MIPLPTDGMKASAAVLLVPATAGLFSALPALFGDGMTGDSLALAGGFAGGCAALYPTVKYLLAWVDRRAEQRRQDERDRRADEQRRQDRIYELMDKIAGNQKDLAVSLVHLTTEVRGMGSPRRRPAPKDPSPKDSAPKDAADVRHP